MLWGMLHESMQAIKKNSLKEDSKQLWKWIKRWHVCVFVFAQNEHILKTIIKICIKMHKNVVVLNQIGSNLIRVFIKNTKKKIYKKNRYELEKLINFK